MLFRSLHAGGEGDAVDEGMNRHAHRNDTLIMDVMVDTTGGGAASLLQMSTANNTDGDLFWQGNNYGQGGNGYGGTGIFTQRPRLPNRRSDTLSLFAA